VTRPPLALPSAATGALTLQATVRDRGFDVGLSLEPGQVVAVLGANGAGKSTLLALIAGLLRPDSGRIDLDGHTLVDTALGRWTPPHQRGVVLLAQEALLFPHLRAAANVAFGPRSRGLGARAAKARAAEWLTAVDAVDLADRRPSQLSGGQAQRIAIARALATDPALLLLDEPMAALDVAVAPALRLLLRSVLRGTGRTALLVTHDILDALSLADRVVVMEDGRLVEDGPTRSVLTQPRSGFAARIAGVNLLGGRADPDGLTTRSGLHVSGLLDPGCTAGAPAVAVFRPNAVAVHLGPSSGSPRNSFRVTVTELEPRGDVVRVHAVDAADTSSTLLADVTAAAVADLELLPGLDVHYVVKATEVSVYPSAA
jgi:molybdate transport system ATP-binding protein